MMARTKTAKEKSARAAVEKAMEAVQPESEVVVIHPQLGKLEIRQIANLGDLWLVVHDDGGEVKPVEGFDPRNSRKAAERALLHAAKEFEWKVGNRTDQSDQTDRTDGKPEAEVPPPGLPPQVGEEIRAAAVFMLLEPGKIEANPENPRRTFDPEKMAELVASVRRVGVLEPVLVRPMGPSAGYQLVAGERRWRAANEAGLTEISAMVRDLSDQEALEISIVENAQREDVNPIEQAEGYRRLREWYSEAEIGEKVGVHQSTVANAIRLLNLSDDVIAGIREGQVSATAGRALLPWRDFPAAYEYASQAALEGASVRQLEAFNPIRCNQYGKPAVAEPIQDNAILRQCEKCDAKRTSGDRAFCMRPDCHKQKTAEIAAKRMSDLKKKHGIPEDQELVRIGEMRNAIRLDPPPKGCKEDCKNRVQALEYGDKGVVLVCKSAKCYNKLRNPGEDAKKAEKRQAAAELRERVLEKLQGDRPEIEKLMAIGFLQPIQWLPEKNMAKARDILGLDLDPKIFHDWETKIPRRLEVLMGFEPHHLIRLLALDKLLGELETYGGQYSTPDSIRCVSFYLADEPAESDGARSDGETGRPEKPEEIEVEDGFYAPKGDCPGRCAICHSLDCKVSGSYPEETWRELAAAEGREIIPIPEEGACSVCGCTEMSACEGEDGGPCSWVTADRIPDGIKPPLCSACLEKLALPFWTEIVRLAQARGTSIEQLILDVAPIAEFVFIEDYASLILPAVGSLLDQRNRARAIFSELKRRGGEDVASEDLSPEEPATVEESAGIELPDVSSIVRVGDVITPNVEKPEKMQFGVYDLKLLAESRKVAHVGEQHVTLDNTQALGFGRCVPDRPDGLDLDRDFRLLLIEGTANVGDIVVCPDSENPKTMRIRKFTPSTVRTEHPETGELGYCPSRDVFARIMRMVERAPQKGESNEE